MCLQYCRSFSWEEILKFGTCVNETFSAKFAEIIICPRSSLSEFRMSIFVCYPLLITFHPHAVSVKKRIFFVVWNVHTDRFFERVSLCIMIKLLFLFWYDWSDKKHLIVHFSWTYKSSDNCNMSKQIQGIKQISF